MFCWYLCWCVTPGLRVVCCGVCPGFCFTFDALTVDTTALASVSALASGPVPDADAEVGFLSLTIFSCLAVVWETMS